MIRRRHGWRLVILGVANLALLGSLFVVAARAVEEVERRELYLAAPEAADGGLTPRAVILEVTPVGVTLGGRTVLRSELPQLLRGPLASLPEPTVVVIPAPDADWRDVDQVLRTARELGAKRIELVAAPTRP